MMDNIREKLVELLSGCGICFHCFPSGLHEEQEKYRIADHLIANGVTVQEWIPVTERLPEKSGEYLITYCGDYDGVCVLYYEVLKTKGKWRTRWKEVTHWMPLPTPPKGESE